MGTPAVLSSLKDHVTKILNNPYGQVVTVRAQESIEGTERVTMIGFPETCHEFMTIMHDFS